MSDDLVERVHAALMSARGLEDRILARAAIREVAAWLDEDQDGDLDFIKFKLRQAAGEGKE